jgi:hypothetical protein
MHPLYLCLRRGCALKAGYLRSPLTWRWDHGSRGRRGERSSSPAADRRLASRLNIAALAIKSGGRKSDVGFTLSGGDVYMGDYLRCVRPCGLKNALQA